MRRSILAVFLAATALACSSAAEEEEVDEDEGALSMLSEDELVSMVVGEVSRGPSLGADFAAKPAAEKQRIVWERATAPDEVRCRLDRGSLAGDALVGALARCKVGSGDGELPEPTLAGSLGRVSYQVFMSLLSKSKLLSPAFDATTNDEMPAGRKKLFHPFGSVAKVELRIDRSLGYTGILAPPADGERFTRVRGLARFSSGGAESLMGFVPGLGLKFFTDGTSIDMHAMHGMRPQVSAEDQKTPYYNVFERRFSNEFLTDGTGVTGSVVRAGVALLGAIHPTPRFVPIDHVGAIGVDGRGVASPSAPKHLTFDPNQNLVTPTAFGYLRHRQDVDYRVILAEMTKNASEENPVVLYTVRAGFTNDRTPIDIDREAPPIGTLVATSPFIPSKFGDRQLFIRHNRGCAPVTKGAETAKAPSPCAPR